MTIATPPVGVMNTPTQRVYNETYVAPNYTPQYVVEPSPEPTISVPTTAMKAPPLSKQQRIDAFRLDVAAHLQAWPDLTIDEVIQHTLTIGRKSLKSLKMESVEYDALIASVLTPILSQNAEQVISKMITTVASSTPLKVLRKLKKEIFPSISKCF